MDVGSLRPEDKTDGVGAWRQSGPYAEGTRVSWVLHVLDEVIHHGAEVGLLRDLYRYRLGL